MRKSSLAVLFLACSLLTACDSAPPPAVGQAPPSTPSLQTHAAPHTTVAAPAAGEQALDELVEAPASKTYPLKTCVVSGEKLGPDRLVYLYKGKEVQFCCASCVTSFRQDPQKYLAKIPAHH